MKVKLVFVKNYVDYPNSEDTFSKDIDVELPAHIPSARLMAARCYDPVQSGSSPAGDINATVIDYSDANHLVGKLLTYIDATFTDPEQRKAHKDIVREMVYGFIGDMSTRAIQTVDSHVKGYTNKEQ